MIKVVFAMLFCLLSFCPIVEATLPADYLAIGGIYLGDSSELVQSVYGEPAHKSRTAHHSLIDGIVEEYLYGKDFLITLADDKVVSLVTFGNNKLATPAGVAVGMDVNVLNSTYRTADAVWGDNTHTTTYVYHGEIPNSYLKFTVKGFTITAIGCSINFAQRRNDEANGRYEVER